MNKFSPDTHTVKATCYVCRKRRQCARFNTYYDRCIECYSLTNAEAETKNKEARANKKPRMKIAYPCIGGPLDGLYAVHDDFYTGYRDNPGGIYAHLRSEYIDYNGSWRGSKTIGSRPTMIYVHTSILKPLISAKDR